MEMEPVYFVLVGSLLFMAEVFKPGFFHASLGLGFFGASISDFLNGSEMLTFLIIPVVAMLSFHVLRPIIRKVFDKDDYMSDPNLLIGHVGRIEKMPVDGHMGVLDIDSDDWSFDFENERFGLGEMARVVRHEATVLYVERANPRKAK